MNPSSSRTNIPGSFPEEDPSPPYSLSAIDIPNQVDRPLPTGWIRQWDTTHQSYFYVDTRINPPHTTWHHPLDDTRHHQTQNISVLAKGDQSWPYLSSEAEPGVKLDSDDFDGPRKKSAEDPQRQVPMNHASPNPAVRLSSNGQNRDIVEALDPREFYPRPTLPATTHGTRRSKLPLRTRLLGHAPISLPFVRREPKWVRRVDKIFDRLQKKEDKLDRRLEKWSGKCERRLLQAEHAVARRGYSIPGPSRT
ncbi:hypothetical protein FRC04_008401 [Tulasnella sp. 424]|nr:hypothetical protein FRC04_008401 [Tulasnella sp. 424]KAG8976772.1 hypothetical protein FRC05_003122 [Tulasnella sp. 425]